MLIHLRFGHFTACLSLNLTACLCLSITTVIAGWQIALWRGAGRHSANNTDTDMHSEALSSSTFGP